MERCPKGTERKSRAPRLLLAAALAAASFAPLLTPPIASAQQLDPTLPPPVEYVPEQEFPAPPFMRLGFHAVLGLQQERGAAARLDVTLLRGGLLPVVHDDLALTLGADVMLERVARDGEEKQGLLDRLGDELDLGYVFPAALQWSLHVSPRFALFPEAGVEVVGLEDPSLRSYFAAGFRLRVGRRVALLGRVTHRRIFHVGLVF